MGEAEGSRETIDFFLLFKRFVEHNRKYFEQLRGIALRAKKSFIIDLNDLLISKEYEKLVELFIDKPEQALNLSREAVADLIKEYFPINNINIDIRVISIHKPISFKGLDEQMLYKLVTVAGAIVKITRVDMKIVKAVFKHDCGAEFEADVHDKIEKPPACPVCNRPGRFRLLDDRCKYIRFQKAVLQELDSSNENPRQIEIVLTSDLVDVARPGDRVTVTGILKTQYINLRSNPVREFYIHAVNVEVEEKREETLTQEDIHEIQQLSRENNIVEKIVNSIAPAIAGHDEIKLGIALSLFGGVPKILPDGTRIRGDIHTLIVGDPGTAKSQLLQFVAKIAPRGVYTSGKGSTAAGLTATVLKDKTTGEYYLEAGALVLADGGVACIDEIDKMREDDRTAIHEALEQQTVSIAKAGIVARLNARTTVIAAANPRSGVYIPTRTLADNINLPPTLLSRFDLIFLIRDIPREHADRSLAKHIIHLHSSKNVNAPINPTLLKKYILYARKNINPVLSTAARRVLEDFYVNARQSSLSAEEESSRVAIPITPRQLEALIRLTEAYARMQLKDIADENDANAIIQLVSDMYAKLGLKFEDMTPLEVGLTSEEIEKKNMLEELILKHIKEHGEISYAKVIDYARQVGLDEKKTNEVVRELLRSNKIYKKGIDKYTSI